MHHPWHKASPLPRQLLAVALFAFASTLSAVVGAREDMAAFLPAEAPRMALSTAQTHALSLLPEVRPPSPAPLLLFTDPNKDPDDLSVLVLARALHRQGFLDLRCVVTTLGDRQTRIRRARFAKDALEGLGLEEVRVAAGLDYSADQRAYNNTNDQPSADYVYERLQSLGIPLVVVTKEAAYAAAVSRAVYDGVGRHRQSHRRLSQGPS